MEVIELEQDVFKEPRMAPLKVAYD